jgi:hypothetical protein
MKKVIALIMTLGLVSVFAADSVQADQTKPAVEKKVTKHVAHKKHTAKKVHHKKHKTAKSAAKTATPAQ